MFAKLFSATFLVLVFTVPVGTAAANTPTVEVLTPVGGEVFDKGGPAVIKVKIDNIPRSGVSLWLQEAVYEEEFKTYSYRFVSSPDYHFKKSKSVIASIPVTIESSPTNTDIRLLARIWQGHYEADGNDRELAADWNEGPYRVVDTRSKNLPDFVIEKIEYVNTSKLAPGKVAKVKVTVRNIGVKNTTQKLEITTFAPRQVYASKRKSIFVTPPKIGETKTYTISGQVNTQTGKDTEFLGLYVDLDPGNVIAELSDRNSEYARVRP